MERQYSWGKGALVRPVEDTRQANFVEGSRRPRVSWSTTNKAESFNPAALRRRRPYGTDMTAFDQWLANLGSYLASPSGFVTALGLVIGGLGLLALRKKRNDFQSRMQRRDVLREQTDKLLQRYPKDAAPSVNIVNAARFEKDYAGGNDFNHRGYQQQYAELLETTDDGIEFINSIVETWLDESGRRTLKRTGRRAANAFQIGLLPYTRLEHIKPEGDRFYWRPIFLARFDGRGRSPYERYLYRETKGETLNPEGRLYYPSISELGEAPISRIRGWRIFIKSWFIDLQSRRMQRRRTKP
jgi:hypothetical protein